VKIGKKEKREEDEGRNMRVGFGEHNQPCLLYV